MRVHGFRWTPRAGWRAPPPPDSALILYFGPRFHLDPKRFEELRVMCPQAAIMGCSTGGQIFGDSVFDDGIAAVAVRFNEARVRCATAPVGSRRLSAEAGRALGRQLAGADLRAALVFSDGLKVNGAALAEGLNETLGPKVQITGGMAGDGAEFTETLVGANAPPRPGGLAAIGLYGSSLRLGSGSAGGWMGFGPKRRITRAEGSILYELDGKPALDLYELYLGDEAPGLPATGLTFPLRIFDPLHPEDGMVRTLRSVDRKARSLFFASDVPQGWSAQLMRSTLTDLVGGAGIAASQARLDESGESLALLVSCIGRRLVLGQRIAEEVEETRQWLGMAATRIGFYSYGELSPHRTSRTCGLHNQTMTITTIAEAA